jgi:hypothetical protein
MRQRVGVVAARTVGIPAAALFYRRNPDVARCAKKNRGAYPAHCRIGLISRPSISYQRTLVLDAIAGDLAFLTGRASQRQFNREIEHARVTVSPFGWGELCLRDFEAVLHGSLLLKPDMAHLETWPNIFVPHETYVPFDWDAKTLRETAHRYLDDPTESARIVGNATDAYAEALHSLPARFESVMEEILTCATR